MGLVHFARYALSCSAAALLVAGCGGLSPNITAAAVPNATGVPKGGSKTFKYTGGEQSFKVPSKVRMITVVADGAAGASNGAIALGGRTRATITVKPGQTLYVFVGGEGASPIGGFNGGGNGGNDPNYCGDCSFGGGGASDVRQYGDGLDDRILVAGGGAGHGYKEFRGGYGGGQTGGMGHGGPPGGQRGRGGSGGTQDQGGAGGAGGDGFGNPGSSGTLGVGGTGGNANKTSGNHFINCGGGGGGGYYGGGGGGSGSKGSGSFGGGSGGAGGGGSSYAEPSAIGVQMWQGWQTDTGNGKIVLSWS